MLEAYLQFYSISIENECHLIKIKKPVENLLLAFYLLLLMRLNINSFKPAFNLFNKI